MFFVMEVWECGESQPLFLGEGRVLVLRTGVEAVDTQSDKLKEED